MSGGADKDRHFGLELHTSRREYVCDGCRGEFPIPEDTEYGRITVKEGGRLARYRLCMRCALALQNRNAFAARPFVFTPGSLKWSTLNSRFRRIWPETVDRMLKTNSQEERREVCDWMLTELGIKLDEEAIMEEKKKKEEKKERTIHREKRELDALKKIIEAKRKELLEMIQELGRLHLKESAAWTRGDRGAVEAAKAEYGKKAAEIVGKINSLSGEKQD